MNGVARILSRIGVLAVAAGLAAPLCACVDLPKDETPAAVVSQATARTSTAVDPNSPAAADVARIAAEPTSFPSFKDIPAVPTDLRSSTQWRESVLALKNTGLALERATAPSTFTLNADDNFAATATANLDPRAMQPPTAAEIAESEAFVKAARARATPPPRPH